MKLLKFYTSLFLTSLLIGCGGGSGEETTYQTAVSPSSIKLDITQYNDAWDKARVYKPYSSTPIFLKDFKDDLVAPVAISLHGCDGVQENNLYLGDKYYPIFLAMQGYLVIEPDSYYGEKPVPGSKLCYTDSLGNTVLAAASFPTRAFDAEYAINKVKASKFWDQKTLLVQGQSQGYGLAHYLKPENTMGVTKWLFSGMTTCNAITYKFTNNAPTLIVNSDADNSKNCIDFIINQYVNIKIKLISGNFHTPISSPEGYSIIKEWVNLN